MYARRYYKISSDDPLNTWVLRDAAANQQWGDVCYSEELDMLVAVSNNGSVGRIMISEDAGKSWELIPGFTNVAWNSVCWGAGLFVISGNGTAQNNIITSPNGRVWTTRTSTGINGNATSVIYGHSGFLVGASGVSSLFTRSIDGISWSAVVSSVMTDANGVGWGNNTYMALYSTTGTVAKVASSTDITNWTAKYSGSALIPRRVAYGNSTFLITSTGTTRVLASVNDGDAWTIRTLPVDVLPWGVCFAEDRFIITAQSGTGANNRSLVTFDKGVTWSVIPTPQDNQLRAVCYARKHRTVVAVSYDGTNQVMTMRI